MDEAFDRLSYDMLLFEDRKMIDEYIPQMSNAEINSFMSRVIKHYIVETERNIEVNEDKNIVIAFEDNTFPTIAKKRKEKVLSTEKIIHNFYRKFLPIKQQNKVKCYLIMAIKNYLDEYIKENAQIEWPLSNNSKDQIHKIYVELAKNNNSVCSIKNVEAVISLYAYRKNKKRAGIIIKNYGPNYIIDNDSIVAKLSNGQDITSYIKSAVYWSSKNSGNNKTGIIWFNGKLINDMWQFPDDVEVKLNNGVLISLAYTTDAYCKMFQRLKIEKLI